MNILENFDVEVNFWEQNPQFIFIEDFNELHKGDKSKGKKDSSQLMWAIALLLDKSKNNSFRNMPEEERKFQLAKYFLKDDNFDWSSASNRVLLERYKKVALSQAMRSLINWEEKMKERDEYITSVSYNANTYKQLDEMLTTYPKLYDMYSKVSAVLQLEDETKDNSKTKYSSEI